MTDYIDIASIPGTGPIPKWPREEWNQIPEGEALDITDQIGDQSVARAATAINNALHRCQLPLRAIRRQGRLYIIHPEQE